MFVNIFLYQIFCNYFTRTIWYNFFFYWI